MALKVKAKEREMKVGKNPGVCWIQQQLERKQCEEQKERKVHNCFRL